MVCCAGGMFGTGIPALMQTGAKRRHAVCSLGYSAGFPQRGARLDEHGGLVVRVGAERLLLLGRHGGVARDERGHHAAGRLDAQRQRRHVQQQQVRHLLVLLAAQDGRLRARQRVRD